MDAAAGLINQLPGRKLWGFGFACRIAGEEIPVLAMQMPSDPSVTRFYTALPASLGAPTRARSPRASRVLACAW
ncbi:TniB family NTP-binding protein [Nocardia sputi]|uniref:TniB family NTP-binding protein n=1 Tax=Nocardia sputi TaxID=2943705 RepID=UPI0035560552